MKKVKITQEQYKKILINLNESKFVKGGINRVDKTTKHDFKSLEEDLSKIVTNPIAGIGDTKMKAAKETPMPKHVNENILSPELHQAIHDVIKNIWLNSSQKHLDKYFIEHGITWGDIISYLSGVGVVAALGGGVYKIKNFFNRKFSPDPSQKMIEKDEEINKIATKLEKDPEAPWSKNKLKDPQGQELMSPEVDENYYTAEPHPDSPEANQTKREPEIQTSNSHKQFKPVAIGMEIAILDGPDGKYSFYYDDIPRDGLPNPEYKLSPEDIADYVNSNIGDISKGEGVKDFEKASLVKIDDQLKNELINLYSKDNNLINSLKSLDETTGAGSSGAFVGPMAMGTPEKQIGEEVSNEKVVKETTTGGGTPQASASGQYTQPAIWAKDKKNWAGDKKTQYPNGEIVSFDPCVKYNNNKKAQNGKCSQGAADGVVKTRKTASSVISKSMYEQIATKTGRKVEDIQKLIESKFKNIKSL